MIAGNQGWQLNVLFTYLLILCISSVCISVCASLCKSSHHSLKNDDLLCNVSLSLSLFSKLWVTEKFIQAFLRGLIKPVIYKASFEREGSERKLLEEGGLWKLIRLSILTLTRGHYEKLFSAIYVRVSVIFLIISVLDCVIDKPSKTITVIYNIVNCFPSPSSVVIILRVSASLGCGSGCQEYHPWHVDHIRVVIVWVLVIFRQQILLLQLKVALRATFIAVVLIVYHRGRWMRRRYLLFDCLRIIVFIGEMSVSNVGHRVTGEALLYVIAKFRWVSGERLRVPLLDHHHIIGGCQILLLLLLVVVVIVVASSQAQILVDNLGQRDVMADDHKAAKVEAVFVVYCCIRILFFLFSWVLRAVWLLKGLLLVVVVGTVWPAVTYDKLVIWVLILVLPGMIQGVNHRRQVMIEEAVVATLMIVRKKVWLVELMWEHRGWWVLRIIVYIILGVVV